MKKRGGIKKFTLHHLLRGYSTCCLVGFGADHAATCEAPARAKLREKSAWARRSSLKPYRRAQTVTPRFCVFSKPVRRPKSPRRADRGARGRSPDPQSEPPESAAELLRRRGALSRATHGSALEFSKVPRPEPCGIAGISGPISGCLGKGAALADSVAVGEVGGEFVSGGGALIFSIQSVVM